MARVELKFFASLREKVGMDSHSMLFEGSHTVASLLKALAEQSTQFDDYYSDNPVLVAVNKTMVEHSHPVHDQDEVALFPPVTGG